MSGHRIRSTPTIRCTAPAAAPAVRKSAAPATKTVKAAPKMTATDVRPGRRGVTSVISATERIVAWVERVDNRQPDHPHQQCWRHDRDPGQGGRGLSGSAGVTRPRAVSRGIILRFYRTDRPVGRSRSVSCRFGPARDERRHRFGGAYPSPFGVAHKAVAAGGPGSHRQRRSRLPRRSRRR